MTTSQLKARLAELLEIKKGDTDDILWAFGELCTEIVESGDTVTFPGVGKLSCNVRAARKARNPRTGESVNVPAKVAIKFALAKSLKDKAPSLKSKAGKTLLVAAEEKQAAADKRKRLRDKETAKAEGKSKGDSPKKKSKKSKTKSRT